MIVQLQIPSEPPASMFSNTEDGPNCKQFFSSFPRSKNDSEHERFLTFFTGACLLYFKITPETCKQLKDLSTASPAVKLWAEWCKKAPTDKDMRARFKVINACTNMEELGFSSLIVSYNAKPILIRRTGTLFKGTNYLEFDIHVHKFQNFARQGIYQISSLCGKMYMQVSRWI